MHDAVCIFTKLCKISPSELTPPVCPDDLVALALCASLTTSCTVVEPDEVPPPPPPPPPAVDEAVPEVDASSVLPPPPPPESGTSESVMFKLFNPVAVSKLGCV